MQIFDYLNKEGLLHMLRKIMGRDVDLTQAEYDALPESKNSDGKNYYIYDSDIAVTAEEVGFDGSTSGSTAANSQQALDELFEKVKDVNSNLLTQYYSSITLKANTAYTIHPSVPPKKRIYFICSVNGVIYTATTLFMPSGRMYLTPDVYLDYTWMSSTNALALKSNAAVFINSIWTSG